MTARKITATAAPSRGRFVRASAPFVRASAPKRQGVTVTDVAVRLGLVADDPASRAAFASWHRASPADATAFVDAALDRAVAAAKARSGPAPTAGPSGTGTPSPAPSASAGGPVPRRQAPAAAPAEYASSWAPTVAGSRASGLRVGDDRGPAVCANPPADARYAVERLHRDEQAAWAAMWEAQERYRLDARAGVPSSPDVP